MHGAYAPVRIAAPSSEAVTLAQAKAQCRVDHDTDDDLITSLVAAATAHLDGFSGVLGRALVTQTWRQDFSAYSSLMRLPLRPVASITSVTYYDADNAQQTLSTSVYELLADALGPFVALKADQEWPSTYSTARAVSVTYVAGVEAADVPAPLKRAILLLVGHWYANREASVSADLRDLPLAFDALIRPYRTIGV